MTAAEGKQGYDTIKIFHFHHLTLQFHLAQFVEIKLQTNRRKLLAFAINLHKGLYQMMSSEYVALDEYDNVLIELGTKKQRIVEYLDNTVGLLKPLDYYIDYEFDQKEAFAFLDEDLPAGRFRKNKVSFILDIVRLGDLFFKLTESKQIQIRQTRTSRVYRHR